MLALGLGNDITSASSITPTHDIHHVTGTTTITTIVPPSPSFSGMVTFITNASNLSFNTGGNIARQFNSVVNVAFQLVYDPINSLWYPVTPS